MTLICVVPVNIVYDDGLGVFSNHRRDIVNTAIIGCVQKTQDIEAHSILKRKVLDWYIF